MMLDSSIVYHIPNSLKALSFLERRGYKIPQHAKDEMFWTLLVHWSAEYPMLIHTCSNVNGLRNYNDEGRVFEELKITNKSKRLTFRQWCQK